METILLLIGLIGLWIGTKWLIRAALGIANLFNLSHSFVGLAILAVGTDLPEIFVTVNASILHLNGIESSGIIVGNAIGSSICQITIILGISGLFVNFNFAKKDLIRDGIALLASIVLLFVFGFDGFISRLEGGILVIGYLIYYLFLAKSHSNENGDNSEQKNYSRFTLVILFIIGITVLILSSHLVVENAMLLAKKWGVAQSFIGIAIIGLGTSLPELAVSIGAAFHKSPGMSIGNIIGSNIFDGFIPIGLGGIISTTSMEATILKIDLPVLFGMTFLVILFLRTKRGISKREGIVLIVAYLLYLGLKIIQN